MAPTSQPKSRDKRMLDVQPALSAAIKLLEIIKYNQKMMWLKSKDETCLFFQKSEKEKVID